MKTTYSTKSGMKKIPEAVFRSGKSQEWGQKDSNQEVKFELILNIENNKIRKVNKAMRDKIKSFEAKIASEKD